MNFNTKKSIKAKDLIINLIFFMFFSLFNVSIAGLEGNEIPISTKEYNQQNPAVVYLSDKGLWFVVWEDDRNLNNDIYGLFIKSDGTLCGNELRITIDAGNQTYPSVTYDRTNQRLLIAWQDARGNTTGGYIYYNYIDVSTINTTDCSGYTFNTANENPIGFTSIFGDSLRSRQKPKINYDPINNQYWIVFLESRSTQHLVAANCFGLGIHNYSVGDTTFIGYAVIDNTLSVTNVDIIRNSPAGISLKSRLISSSRAEFEEIYTFEFFTEVDNPVIGIDTTTNQQLFVYEGVRHLAKLTCSCTDLDGNNLCNAGDGITSTLTLEPDPEGGIKHIYGIWNTEIPLGSIYHRHIDANLTTHSYNPHIAFDYISKRFLVVWENIGDSGNTKIYGQLISSGTGLYNTNILISYQDIDGDGNQDKNIADSKQTRPYVEYDPVNQRFFVIWQDGRNGTVSTENLDIYGQYIDSEGSLRGNNYIINTQAFNQRDPVIAFNSINQQYLAVWKDARKANDDTCGTGTQPCGSDIYGQRFSIGQPQILLLKNDMTILSPASINFGNVIANGSSSEYIFYIKNSGDTGLNIDCITEKNTNLIPTVYEFNGLPSELSACDGNTLSLQPGTFIPVSLVFHPQSAGSYQMTLQITSDATQSVEIHIQGLATTTGGNLNVSDSLLNFGSIIVGSSSTLKATLTNTGDGNLTINQILSIPAGYTVTLGSTTVTAGNPINQVIPPGASIDLHVSFNPNTEGIYTGSFTIDTDYNDVVINLSGIGVTPDITITAPAGLNFGDTLDFGNVQIGTSYTKMIKIKNNSYIPVNLNVINNPLDKFTIGNITLPYTLQPGSTLDVYITFTPTDTTSINTSVGFLFDGDTEPREIFLTGQGIETVSTTGTFKLQDLSNNDINLINFGKMFIYDSKEIQLKIVNTSSANALTINRITLSNQTDFYLIGLNTPFTLNPNDSREFKVAVTPTKLGTITGTLTVEDNTGATLTVDLSVDVTDFKVSTNTGSVVDFTKLSQVPYPNSKPSNFSAYGAYSFIINTGDSTNPKTVNVSVTLSSLPANLAVYKVKNDGTWTRITNIVVSGNTISYSIEDNGTLDIDGSTGIIEDPIVIGSESTTTTDTLTNGGTTTFPEISGGGGCSFGSNTDYSISGILAILLIMVLRVFNMRKTAVTGLFAAIGIFISSCGTGPGSDVGNSVFIETLNIDPTYITADIVDRKDIDGDGTCDYYVISAENVLVNVTFKSTPVGTTNIVPSDVIITKYTVEYYPANSTSPAISPQTFPTTCTIKSETETTCYFIVASYDLKEIFYNYYINNNLTGSYHIKIKAEGNEVLYDKDITLEFGAEIKFDQFLGANDDPCTP